MTVAARPNAADWVGCLGGRFRIKKKGTFDDRLYEREDLGRILGGRAGRQARALWTIRHQRHNVKTVVQRRHYED